MQILAIDERDCFNEVREYFKLFHGASSNITASYFVAPTPEYFDAMISQSQGADVIICHRKIWIDECDDTDTCTRLEEFRRRVNPISCLLVGNETSTHATCPLELRFVAAQVCDAYVRLGRLVGAKVRSPNTAFKSEYLRISSLEIIGYNQLACTLEVPSSGRKVKYFKLRELQPA